MENKHVVLYADDDEDDRNLVEDIFAAYPQVHLKVFESGLELLSYLNKQEDNNNVKPCLVILDINMPVLSGKDTLAALRKQKGFEHVPAILFTTSSQLIDRNFAISHDAGFITKPINHVQVENIAEVFISHCADEVKNSIKKTSI